LPDFLEQDGGSEPEEPAAGQQESAERRKARLPERGRMRRRLRRQQRVREALLLDLGALVFELHRQGRREPELLQAKAAELTAVDDEVRGLADALDVSGELPQLVAPGIAGSCENCGEILTADARFCSTCGVAVGLELEPEQQLSGDVAPEVDTSGDGVGAGEEAPLGEVPPTEEPVEEPPVEEEPVEEEPVEEPPVEQPEIEPPPEAEPPPEEAPFEEPALEEGPPEEPVEEGPAEEEPAATEPPESEPPRRKRAARDADEIEPAPWAQPAETRKDVFDELGKATRRGLSAFGLGRRKPKG
jgi:hypothetical protein